MSENTIKKELLRLKGAPESGHSLFVGTKNSWFGYSDCEIKEVHDDYVIIRNQRHHEYEARIPLSEVTSIETTRKRPIFED